MEFRQPVDVEDLKRLANAALDRARLLVYAVPVAGESGFTLSVEREAQLGASLPAQDAQRYAAAINGEAELARAMVRLLIELEALRARAPSGSPPLARHGSGTMQRVTLPSRPDDTDKTEEKAG